MRIGPLSNVKPIWDHGMDGYPTRVRLAMADGHIVTFWREAPQPKPKRWNPIREIIGYPRQTEYQPRHLKTGGAANTDRPVRKFSVHILSQERSNNNDKG